MRPLIAPSTGKQLQLCRPTASIPAPAASITHGTVSHGESLLRRICPATSLQTAIPGPAFLVDYVIVHDFALRLRRSRTSLRKVDAAPHTADDHARQYAAFLLVQAREELIRVDTKASIMLAAVGVALGVVLGDLVSRSWSPFRLPLPAP